MKYLFIAVFFLPNFLFSQVSTTEKIGDVGQLLLPIAAGASTLLLKDKEGVKQFAKSYIVTASLTYILKYTVKKQRPSGGMHSFPSGHTSSAFSGASFIQRRYGWKYGVPAYALAAFTGYSRVYADKHYPIDVVAGAIIGVGSTYLFTTPYQKEHMELSFTRNVENDFLVGFKYKF